MNQTQDIVTHATFTIDRTFAAPVAKVYGAFSDPAAWSQWFVGGDGWTQRQREFNFHVGGTDRVVGAWSRGGETEISDYTGRYSEIVPNERIVMTYDMHLDGKMISASLLTLEFRPDRAGTRLILTETVACLNGFEDQGARGRQHGTNEHLKRIEAYLAKEQSK
jgi:uncharacterized protein YndB with AHSA1/START domain